jgi:hypothetical protein
MIRGAKFGASAVIPWPLVPATLIRPPLIRSPLAPPLATVAQPESANAQRADGPILGSSYSG